MSNQNCMELFNKYLVDVKHASENTLSSYMRDIRQLSSYLDTHGDSTLDTATNKEIGEYVNWLKAAGKSVATVSRNIASMKCFYSYMVDNNLIEKNPAISIIPDKNTQKLPQILTSAEVELLLEQPACVDAKGYRDKAMLELLYAMYNQWFLQFFRQCHMGFKNFGLSCKVKSRLLVEACFADGYHLWIFGCLCDFSHLVDGVLVAVPRMQPHRILFAFGKAGVFAQAYYARSLRCVVRMEVEKVHFKGMFYKLISRNF